MPTQDKDLTSEEALRLLTLAVWNASDDNDGECSPEKVPTFRQLDDLISTTAWGAEAREDFFRRWIVVETATSKRFEVGSFAELAHMVWQEVGKNEPQLKHPLAPLIHEWHTRPKEVQPVRDTDGNLRSDTIAPRIAMRESGARTDRLYLTPAHIVRQRPHIHQKSAGSKVFIGHGRSLVWREFKDFIEERLGLPTNEFNSVSVAGFSTKERLSEMLDEATIAFLIMTGEDEQSDGNDRARENVVHEVGLFQGRLGFERAIVLLEEGCEEFSNITGLGQIRFPKGSIKSAFEEVRRVCEREELLLP